MAERGRASPHIRSAARSSRGSGRHRVPRSSFDSELEPSTRFSLSRPSTRRAWRARARASGQPRSRVTRPRRSMPGGPACGRATGPRHSTWPTGWLGRVRSAFPSGITSSGSDSGRGATRTGRVRGCSSGDSTVSGMGTDNRRGGGGRSSLRETMVATPRPDSARTVAAATSAELWKRTARVASRDGWASAIRRGARRDRWIEIRR